MIKLIWIYLAIQASCITRSNALYHEPSKETIKKPLDILRNDSYFGFSIAYRETTKSLIISAPRADNIGRLYTCDIDTKECKEIKNHIVRQYSEYSHDYWLGATVRAGPSFVITCAPLHMQESYSYKEPIANSVCFKINNDTNIMETLPQIGVIDRNANTVNLLEEKIDSFGWSIDVSSDKSIIVGGPGMFTGRIMKYNNPKAVFAETISGKNIKGNVKYNLGYSVASGKFFSSSSVSYAVGTPFGSYGSGRVIFLNKKLKYLYELNVEEVGTMFGAVLCSVHMSMLNGLLVGAPAFAEDRQYNVGAVYIYLPHRGNPKFFKKLVGFKDNSFFGSAIVSVGDLNGDSYDEIAIAAPYEDDGRGAVYLYSGVKIMVENIPTYLQRIQTDHSRGFGLSLASLKDFDENGCNELAIGAPESDTVTLLRCMASVHVVLFTKFPNLQNRKAPAKNGGKMNETYFEFQSCLKVTYPPKPSKVVADIFVNIDLKHRDASLAYPSKDKFYEVSLQKKLSVYCRNVGVRLPLGGNYNLDIVVNITATLKNDPINSKTFETSRVRLASHSILSIQDTVSAAECNGKLCEPKLDVEISTSIVDTKKYICGSSEFETIHFKIHNTGDIAYSACMKATITGAPIKKISSNSCSMGAGSRIITCVPLRALDTNKSWDVGDISIQTSQLTNEDKQISVDVALYDNCIGQESMKRNLDIDLISDTSRIFITGNTDVGKIVNMTIDDVKYHGKKFEHIYTINNEGYTNLITSYKVELPKQNYIQYSEVNVHTETEGILGCAIKVTSTNEPDIAECNYNKLDKNRKINVIINIEILRGTLNNILSNANVSVNTKLIMEQLSRSHGIETLVTLQVATVPYWIYIIAAVVGIMILVLISLILRELGFLRRENKEKLDRLRRSVRRQTIRQSMMAQSTQRERQRILEDQNDVQIVEDNNTINTSRAS